jgi:TRAP-type C4-dicarboxylate transport system substrate-binding protein
MQMTRRIPLLLSAFSVALGFTVANTADAQQFRLRWGHYLADGPFLQYEKDYARKIEERTKGRVKIDMTFAGGLGKGAELLLLVGRGAVDMSSTPPGYNPDQLRYWRAFQIPFVFKSSEQAMDVLYKVVEEFPVYRQEMDKMGVVWLFQQPLGIYYMTGPSPDCASVDKLRGKKIRSFGADIPKAHSAVGAVPVTVDPTGIYEGLKLGTIDYSFINAGNIQQYKLWEVGKHNCGPLTAITGHNITIGKKTWSRLPPDIQKIFLDQARETAKEYLAWVGEAENKAVQNIKAQGGIFHEFPAAELRKWKAASPDFLALWEKDTAAATGDAETPRKVAARWKALTAN